MLSKHLAVIGKNLDVLSTRQLSYRLATLGQQAMRAAENGLYCAPLRLLAMEVADACNLDGTFCTLITGTHVNFSSACQ